MGMTQGRHCRVRDKIISILEGLNYKVWHSLLSTAQHGVPHRRVRLYVVAIRADSVRKEFSFPAPIPLKVRCKHIVARAPEDDPKRLPENQRALGNVKHAYQAVRATGKSPRKFPVIVDTAASEKYRSHRVAALPCLTAQRGQTCGAAYWASHVGRPLTLRELWQFQGVSGEEADVIMETISTAQTNSPTRTGAPSNCRIGHMLGNTMSLNVIERVLCRALPAAGLAVSATDRWAS